MKYLLLTLLLLLTACGNFESFYPSPKNYTPEIQQNLTTNETINNTNLTEPDVILYEDELVIYVKTNTFIIKTKENSILLDTGNEDNSQQTLIDLRNIGIEQLDAIILSNMNLKKIGGFPYFYLKTKPKKVYETGIRNENTDVFESVINESIKVGYDDIFLLGDLTVYLLVPYDDGAGFSDNPNSNSIITRMYYKGFSILFMSDCGYECEEREQISETKVLVVSDNCDSTSLLFLQKVNPEIAIMTTDCSEIKKRLDNLNIPIYNKVNIIYNGNEYIIK